jgi:hypothetical protein
VRSPCRISRETDGRGAYAACAVVGRFRPTRVLVALASDAPRHFGEVGLAKGADALSVFGVGEELCVNAPHTIVINGMRNLRCSRPRSVSCSRIRRSSGRRWRVDLSAERRGHPRPAKTRSVRKCPFCIHLKRTIRGATQKGPELAGLSQSRRPESNRGPLHYESPTCRTIAADKRESGGLFLVGAGQNRRVRDIVRDTSSFSAVSPTSTRAQNQPSRRSAVRSDRRSLLLLRVMHSRKQ